MAADFTHLHVHTDGSLLDGGNPLDKVLARARDLGMKSVAITDHGVMYNLWKLQESARKYNVKPILGMEAYVAPAHRGDTTVKTPMDKWYSHLVLLAENETGYKNLVKLSSLGFTEGMYYKPRVDRETLERHSEGLIVSSACLAGEVAQNLEAARLARTLSPEEVAARWRLPEGTDQSPEAVSRRFAEGARETVAWYKRVFGERYLLEVQAHRSQGQAELNQEIFALAGETDTPVVATTDAHFLRREDHQAHDCLICVGMKKNVDDPARLRYDEGLYFQTGEEVGTFFRGRTDVLDSSMTVADRVNVGFQKRYHVPNFPLSDEQRQKLDARVDRRGGVEAVLSDKTRADAALSPDDLAQRAREVELLRALALRGAKAKYGDPLPTEVRERMDYELKVISDAGYAGYHLIVADFIAAARAQDIPVGPGRGSAAGSLVCYAVGITNVDPLKFDLLFERFLNPERVSMPDVDVDFCEENRGRVIEYVKQKYGEKAVCQIITFGTMASRAVVKDVGRVLGFLPKETDDLAKLIPNAPNYSLSVEESIQKVPEVRERYQKDARYRRLLDLAVQLEDLKRSAGVHAAGVVIAPGPVDDYVPVSLTKDGGLVSQYDMNDLEHAGMLKMDFLGLTTLTVIREASRLVRERYGNGRPGAPLDRDAVNFEDRNDFDDETTYTRLRQGHTAGVFQFESPLATEVLGEMRCDRFEDLVASNALLRPGPLDTGMHKAYIRRKRGEETVSYPHPLLEPVLKNTFGIITYQEQIMRAAQVLGGYSLGEADMLRKAVGKKDAELIASELKKFVERCLEKGTTTREQAQEIAALIETFGRYGFNRSHSVAYSVLAYQTAYLKAHYPAQFMAALLSSAMDNTDKLNKYLQATRDMRLAVLAPHVNESGLKFNVVTRQVPPGATTAGATTAGATTAGATTAGAGATTAGAEAGPAGAPEAPPAPGSDEAIRFGLTAIKGVGETMVQAILSARAAGPFADYFDFIHRVVETGKLNTGVLRALIVAGALDGLGPSRAAMEALVEPVMKETAKNRRKTLEQKKRADEAAARAAAGEPELPLPKTRARAGAAAAPTGPVRLPYPEVSEWDPRERLGREKEAIGLYVSGHPLEGLGEVARAISSHAMGDLTGFVAGKVRVAGVITSVEERTTKSKGERMAKFTIEDQSGGLNVVAFPKDWAKYDFLIKPGALAVIDGAFSESERELDRVPDLRLDRAQNLLDALSAGEVAVSIQLDPAVRADETSMGRIRQILADHEGNAQVFIEDATKGRREAKSRVRPSPDLLEQLRQVAGSERVRLLRGMAEYDRRSRGSYGGPPRSGGR